MRTPKEIKSKLAKYRQVAAALAVGMMSVSDTVYADDSVQRLLNLQLKKGIITQQEYDEFMSATSAPTKPETKAEPGSQASPVEDETSKSATPVAPAPIDTEKKTEPAKQAGSPDNVSSKGPTSTSSEGGVAVIKTDTLKVELFGVLDLSIGYTSHSLVASGEMPTSIGPWISGGVKYPKTVPAGPGGASIAYPASNMSSQTGLFNSALSTSSWGIRASRDIGPNGFKAFIVLDSAINPATGQLTDQSHNESVNSKYPTTAYATSSLNGQLFSKEAVIGMSENKWGRITFGRNTNFILDVMNSYSPLQKAGLFMPYGNGVYGAGGGISENGRVDNSAKYQNKYGNVNYGLLYGFGGTGGLQAGAQGAAGNIGYQTGRFGIQLVYESFRDLLKTSTDASVSNVIDLTAYDQHAALLTAKYNLTDRLEVQAGVQQAKLTNPTADPNIPFISNLYGENVNKSTSYIGEPTIINTAHVGFGYNASERIYVGAAFTFVELPKFNFGTPTAAGQFPSHYLGGDIDAWSGLAIYKLYKATDIYAGMVYTHYWGPAFDSTSSTIYVHDIFTTATGFRFKF